MSTVAVPVTLRRELAAARERGEEFASAWPDALAAAVDGLPRWDVEPWKKTLTETVEAWRAAFERRTVSPLAAALGTIGQDREMQDRLEEECAGPGCKTMVIVKRAPGSAARAACSERCRRRATEAADREAVAV